MRKSIAVFAASLFIGSPAWAAPVTPQEASLKASAFLSASPGNQRRSGCADAASANLSLAYTRNGDNSPLFYIFNDSDGFIIVSADDKFPAVLGYSDAGKFEETRIPPNMKEWLDGYARQMNHYLPLLPDGFGLDTNRMRVNRAPVSPLLSTKWDQGSPYNLLCPTDQYGQAVTGCVATAYAQIMNYHEWPKNPVGSHGGIIFNGTTYNWRLMLDEYDQGKYTAAQANAVATLMRQCGAAVDMTYSAWASGAYSFNVPTALTRYFQYDPGLTMLWKDYIPQKEWNETVYQEIAAGRPVYYSGSSSQGGHAFVCDGYSDNEYFHFNWGWGGYEDGYFLLTALNPASGGIGSYEDGYTSSQCIITGIKPGTESSDPTQIGLIASGGFYHSNGTTFEIREGESGNVIYNPFGYAINVQPGIKISPADGNGEPVFKECGSAVRLNSMYGFNYLTAGSLPKLNDGIYHITPVFRAADNDRDWTDVPVPIGKQDFVELTITNGNATYNNVGPANSNTPHLIFGSPEFSNLYGGLPVAVRIPVVNVGQGDFNAELGFSLMDSEDDFGASSSVMDKYMVPSGSSTNIEVSFNDDLPAANYSFSIIDMEDKTYLDNYHVTLKDVSVEQPSGNMGVSELSPNFFTAGKASPLYFSVANKSLTSTKVEFTFEVLNGSNLHKIKTLPVTYNVTVPGNYSGRINVRPTDLDVPPGNYFWRVTDPSGTPLSLPSPMCVNSEVLVSDGISYVETSRDGKEAMIVAPEGEPYTGEITVPENINGLKIKGLRNNAFTFSTVSEVTLPETITRLDQGTFYAASSLRNFISESKTIIPFYPEIFPGSLNNIWLNVDQSLIEEWHAISGWNGMRTPAWIFNLQDVEIESGLEVDPSTGIPYSPYRMNFATPLFVKFNVPEGKNVEVIMIIDNVWVMQCVINPTTDILDIPAIGLNSYGEIRAAATTEKVGIDGISNDIHEAPADIFAIDGRIILRNAEKSQISRLPAGLYICKGKKIMVK